MTVFVTCGSLEDNQRVLISALTDYTITLGQKVDDLIDFRTWAVPKLTECEIQVVNMRAEIKELRGQVQYRNNSKFHGEQVSSHPSSPLTPSTQSID